MSEWVSPYIVAGACGWIVAQLLKYAFASVKQRRAASLRQLYFSGNMPSAHSATVIAVLTVIGITEGVNSAIFGLGLVFASVVVYDALMVRRSSGEQGVAITSLLKEQKSKVPFPRVAMGHTPSEVLVGAILGVGIGLFVGFIGF